MEEREAYGVSKPVGREHGRLLNPVYIVALACFPALEDAFYQKLDEGYKVEEFSYEGNERTSHERIRIVFMFGYERFVMTQGKGNYAGGFSRITFGRDGEVSRVL